MNMYIIVIIDMIDNTNRYSIIKKNDKKIIIFFY